MLSAKCTTGNMNVIVAKEFLYSSNYENLTQLRALPLFFFLFILVGYLIVKQHTNMRTHQLYSYFCVNLEIRHPIVHSYIVYIIFQQTDLFLSSQFQFLV